MNTVDITLPWQGTIQPHIFYSMIHIFIHQQMMQYGKQTDGQKMKASDLLFASLTGYNSEMTPSNYTLRYIKQFFNYFQFAKEFLIRYRQRTHGIYYMLQCQPTNCE